MPSTYLQHMRTEVTSNRDHPSLCRSHACEVDASSISQTCRWQRPVVDLVAGGIMSSYMYVGTVSHAVLVAMSQVAWRHMRIRLKECLPWGQVIDWH